MMFRISLGLDPSIALQAGLATMLDARVNLVRRPEELRLSGSNESVAEARESLRPLRTKHPEPWLTFIGTGDFHHVTHLLLETLPPTEKLTLVVIDNHPDWFSSGPRYHCGNWVAGALKLPNVARVILCGQNSNDLKGWKFHGVPFEDLLSGRLRIHPYSLEKVWVPFRSAPKQDSKNDHLQIEPKFGGIELRFEPLMNKGPQRFFADLADELADAPVYVSLDKDCLSETEVVTDWEQGELTADEVFFALRALSFSSRIVGADVTGELSPDPLKGIWKRLDAFRFHGNTHLAFDNAPRHDQLNMQIVSLLDERESFVEERRVHESA